VEKLPVSGEEGVTGIPGVRIVGVEPEGSPALSARYSRP